MTFILVACHTSQPQGHVVKVGVLSGPDIQLMEVAKVVALKKYGLHIQTVDFSDYTMLNSALNDGSIDANVFQHEPYLNEVIKARHYNIVAIGKTFIYPMAVYSKKLKNMADVPLGATIAIPNDPSNEARALLLLQSAGLITLKGNANIEATPVDIRSNPKHLVIKELDAAQLPRVLPDVAFAVINNNYAVAAGLLAKRDAIYVEGPHSRYANVIVVRDKDRNNPKMQELVKALHSAQVEDKAQILYQDQGVVPAWTEAEKNKR